MALCRSKGCDGIIRGGSSIDLALFVQEAMELPST